MSNRLFILWNIFLTIRSRRHSPPSKYPRVSILIPARNEERAIADCVESLLRQDYPDFEVLVLDDGSTDNTRTILAVISKKYSELIILDGRSSSGQQPGKNWACTQLAQQAQGELLLFTDADTVHKPQALTHAVNALMGGGADLITGYPKQSLGTWGERLLVPFFSWAVISFFPLGFAYKLASPILASAVGQMMLFKRTAYQAIGGHSALNSSIVDDLALVRNLHKHNFRWRVIYIADLISCRMYQNSRDALNGFTKNLFAGFGYRILKFLLVWLWLGIAFLEPIAVLALALTGLVSLPGLSTFLAAAATAASLLIWGTSHWRFRFPIYLTFLYPVSVILALAIAIGSMAFALTGQADWKGRTFPKPDVKWW